MFVLILRLTPTVAVLAGLAALAYLILPNLGLVKEVCHPFRFSLCHRSWSFKSISRGHISLHFDAELRQHWVPELLLKLCESEFTTLAAKFRNVRIAHINFFVFADKDEISAIFGETIGGIAFPFENAVIVADGTDFVEDLRHELTHVFAWRWNSAAPALLSEGLSGYQQGGRMWGWPLAAVANRSLARHELSLPQMLNDRFFYAEPHNSDCYILAASFTSYLIGRFGWERYESLYRTCRAACFEADFQKCLGISLKEAEAQWRADTASPGSLMRRLGKIVWLAQQN